MIYKIKNTGLDSKVFGELTISADTEYIVYNSKLDLYGNRFKDFKDNFGIFCQNEVDFIYFIDNVEVPIGTNTFYSDMVPFMNNPRVDTFKDNQNYRIYTLLNEDKKNLGYNPTILPSSVNYKIDISKLHRNLIFKKGILIKAEYFENVTITQDIYSINIFTYDTPVLKCEYEYHIDDQGYIGYRYTRRYWAYIDGTYSTEYKEGPKYYTKVDARNEAVKRRNNIINETLMSSIGLLLYTDTTINTLNDAENAARMLLGEIDPNIDKYNKRFSDPLIEQITTIDESLYLLEEYSSIGKWLDNLIPATGDTTIRQMVLSNLGDGVLIPGETITID